MIQRSRSNFIGLCDEYDVVTANDMQTAIRRATFYKPDISILDLQMPPGEIRRQLAPVVEFIKGHLAHSRVLIMSSNSTSEIRSSCLAAGADGFFENPSASRTCWQVFVDDARSSAGIVRPFFRKIRSHSQWHPSNTVDESLFIRRCARGPPADVAQHRCGAFPYPQLTSARRSAIIARYARTE